MRPTHGQKAPSTKRCIKTPEGSTSMFRPARVRKHRAPKGALRLRVAVGDEFDGKFRQEAPSTIRCIKTCSARAWG